MSKFRENEDEEKTQKQHGTHVTQRPDLGKTVVQYIWNTFIKLGSNLPTCYHLGVEDNGCIVNQERDQNQPFCLWWNQGCYVALNIHYFNREPTVIN